MFVFLLFFWVRPESVERIRSLCNASNGKWKLYKLRVKPKKKKKNHTHTLRMKLSFLVFDSLFVFRCSHVAHTKISVPDETLVSESSVHKRNEMFSSSNEKSKYIHCIILLMCLLGECGFSSVTRSRDECIEERITALVYPSICRVF